MRRRSTYSTTAAATAAIPSTTHMYGWSAMNSVKSSWATWIHHSCGSLMKIQMNAAIPTTATAPIRSGFQRVRTNS